VMKSPRIVQSKGRECGCQNEGKNEVFKVPPHVYSTVFQLLGLRERENEMKPAHVFFESSTLPVLSVLQNWST
jgi:hypothetical protein